VQAPLVEAGWRFFDRRLVHITGAGGVVVRVLCDQCLMAPPSLVGFFVTQGTLEGKSLQASLERASTCFWPTYAVCFPFWCTCHLLTFSVVPPKWRMAYASCCGVMWNAIISGRNQEAIILAEERTRAGEDSS